MGPFNLNKAPFYVRVVHGPRVCACKKKSFFSLSLSERKSLLRERARTTIASNAKGRKNALGNKRKGLQKQSEFRLQYFPLNFSRAFFSQLNYTCVTWCCNLFFRKCTLTLSRSSRSWLSWICPTTTSLRSRPRRLRATRGCRRCR